MSSDGLPEGMAVATRCHGFKDSAAKPSDGRPRFVEGIVVGDSFGLVGLPVGEPAVRCLGIEVQQISATMPELGVGLFGAPILS